MLPLPTPAGPFDRSSGAQAIAAVPVVGIYLGAIVAGLGATLSLTSLPTLACGFLAVAALGLLTRGMHLDGLADTADGLGCYGDTARVTQVMRSGSAGPFAIASIVIIVSLQATTFGYLFADHRWYAASFAVAVSRFGAVAGCRWRLQPLPDSRFGALVIGTQRWSILLWLIVFAAAGGLMDTDQWWRGVTIAVVVVAVAYAISEHCARRFRGVNGDVLGAIVEITTALALLIALL